MNYTVPNQGVVYYQNTNTGNGYVHVWAYHEQFNVREYVQTEFIDTLIQDQLYKLNFYANLANPSQFCIKSIGVCLSSFQINESTFGNITSCLPQIVNNYWLCDTLEWMKITGFYLANGDELFLTIGNFYDSLNTDTLRQYPTNLTTGSTYYIDDVSFVEFSPQGTAGSDTTICYKNSVQIGQPKTDSCTFNWSPSIGLDDPNKSNPIASPDSTTTYILTISGCGATITDTVTVFVNPCIDASEPLVTIYPNPALDEITIEYSSEENFQLVFYDMIGRKVMEEEIEPGYYQKTEINLVKLSVGIYNVFVIQNDEIVKTEKIIVIK